MSTITAAHALNDIIEALCHEIILHPEKRAKLSDQLTFFTKSIDREHNVFGRCWCALLLTFCSDSLDREILESSEFDDWDIFVQNLSEAKESILRKDAVLFIPPTIADKSIEQDNNFANLEDESVDEERSKLSVFNEDLVAIIRLCRVHQALSFIRVPLLGSTAPVSGKNKNELVISKNDITTMKKFIDKKFGKDMEEHEFLCSLFERNKLKSVPELTQIIESHKEYTIEYFLKATERLLQSWYKVIMVEPPILISSGYFYGRSNVVAPKTPRKRASTYRFASQFAPIPTEHTEDIQDESAKKMPAIPTENVEFEQGEYNERVASANAAVGSMVVGIDSADDDDGEGFSTTGNGKTLNLSSPPPRVTMMAIDPPTKTYTSSPYKKRKRVMWTVEEKNAVRRGVSKFGEGNWKNVKLEYPVILAHRSNVQIKDCWRVMVKKGDTALEVEGPGAL